MTINVYKSIQPLLHLLTLVNFLSVRNNSDIEFTNHVRIFLYERFMVELLRKIEITPFKIVLLWLTLSVCNPDDAALIVTLLLRSCIPLVSRHFSENNSIDVNIFQRKITSTVVFASIGRPGYVCCCIKSAVNFRRLLLL